MASRKGKRVRLPQPLALTAAGTVLLLGWHMHSLLSDIPRERVAAYPPQTLPPAPSDLPRASSGAGAPVPGRPAAAAKSDGPKLAENPLPSSSLPLSPPALLPAIGNAAPVHGPQWQQAPLPAFSPELLQAMMDPRAARRARRLRRLGIALPAEPASSSSRPAPSAPLAGPELGKTNRIMAPVNGVPAAVSGNDHPPPALGTSGAEPPASDPTARLDRAEPNRTEPSSAAPAAATTDAAKTAAAKPAAGEPGSGEAKPIGESGKREAAVPPPAPGPPVWLRAHLDHPRSAYRVGEWVALRFLASRPVHLRVYRVDPAGRVTRVFSTYSRDEAGKPARNFSMMVKAGEPKPGQEGMIAIGSTRPLTHDELLACLRASMAEAPASSSAPPAPASAPADAAAPADALKAVIDAVGRAADTPEASPAPLDRSGWSVAIGQFTSAASKLSDDHDPPSSDRQSAIYVPATMAARRRTF